MEINFGVSLFLLPWLAPFKNLLCHVKRANRRGIYLWNDLPLILGILFTYSLPYVVSSHQQFFVSPVPHFVKKLLAHCSHHHCLSHYLFLIIFLLIESSHWKRQHYQRSTQIRNIEQKLKYVSPIVIFQYVCKCGSLNKT